MSRLSSLVSRITGLAFTTRARRSPPTTCASSERQPASTPSLGRESLQSAFDQTAQMRSAAWRIAQMRAMSPQPPDLVSNISEGPVWQTMSTRLVPDDPYEDVKRISKHAPNGSTYEQIMDAALTFGDIVDNEVLRLAKTTDHGRPVVMV